MRTQVGIVGAGPAGLMLAQLLQLEGIESVVLEARSREYVEQRVRAGVLEQGTVDLLDAAGVGERMHREGLVHHGIELQFDGERHRIPLSELADGRSIVVYGQTEVVKDLIEARLAGGAPLLFEVADVSVHDLDGDRPLIRFEHEGRQQELECDVIAGCDGFHGVCRPSIPIDKVLRTFSREYPFGWLGILAAVAPSSDELIYAHHERGFALHSLRSPELSRLYLQCRPDEDIGEWPGRAHLGGAADAPRARRLDARRGPGAREGRDGHAQLRRRADAATAASTWPATRRTSSRRPARRASTSRSPTCACSPRRSRAGTGRAARRCSTPTRRPACAASGAPSTSPGG